MFHSVRMVENVWEDRFVNWANGPGQTEADQCDNAVRAVRKAIGADEDLSAFNISVFPQGSFRARTNVPGDSDVDVCIRYNTTFFADYPDGKRNEDFGNVDSSFTFVEFKSMVERALVNYFGRQSVRRGNKAFDVHANTYRIDADVVPTFEQRRYTGGTNVDGTHHYLSGVAFRTDSNQLIENWPDQNYENGVSKNDRCQRRYKRAVRIVKRLCYRMQNEGVSDAKGIGSFLIECLIWNAPDRCFQYPTFTEILYEALGYVYANTISDDQCSEWGEVNELKYLFRNTQPWTRSQAHSFLGEAWSYVGFR
jgi:hypothetical protein